MSSEPSRSKSFSVTQQNLIPFPTIIAVAILTWWIVRDGFGWGDVLGALAIWLGTFLVLAVIRRIARR